MSLLFTYVLVGWFWYALMGLAAIVVVVHFGIQILITDPIEDKSIKHRGRWLRQHFGREGARRWVKNLIRDRAYASMMRADWAVWEAQKFHSGDPSRAKDAKRRMAKEGRLYRFLVWLYGEAAMSPAVRGPDGKTLGVVIFTSDRLDAYHWLPPWGRDFTTYNEACPADGTSRHIGQMSNGAWHHGEPTATDWLAAGFWDRGVKELRAEWACYWRHYGMPLNAPIRDSEELRELAKQDAIAAGGFSRGQSVGELLGIGPYRVR